MVRRDSESAAPDGDLIDEEGGEGGGGASEFHRRRTAHVDEILDTMADVVLQLDETGVVQYANDAVTSVLGYSVEALIGRPIDYVFAPPEANEQLSESLSSGAFVDRLLSERQVTDITAVFRTASGQPVPMSLSASILEADAGGVEGIVCVAKDISERRAAEERTDFLLSLLRHDVQNKLHVTGSYVELLAEDAELTENEREYAQRALQGVSDAGSLIKRVDAVHELDGDIETTTVDLAGVVADAVDRHDALRAQADVTVDVAVPNGTRARGHDLLTELFANLVENAVRHSEGDRVEISVEESPDTVRVRVDDDGVGIPEDRRERVFESGFSTRDETGSGQGLGLVRQIADACGGTVTAGESPLGGARVVVELPR